METDFFKEENIVKDCVTEKISPSGRFKLIVTPFKTKPGSWNYTRGTVIRVSDNKEICKIDRNYGVFHHTFVTKKGQEYLITGRNYLTQTIVNLDTEEVFESKGSTNGYEFCWSTVYLSPDENTLIVDDCIWAAPYEYRFYDFSDPSKGWPELEISPEDVFIETDHVKLEFDGDCFVTNHSRERFKPLNKFIDDLTLEEIEAHPEIDDESTTEHVIHSAETWKREGNSIVQVSSWVSLEEKERRQKQAEARQKYEESINKFKKEDPLYLEYIHNIVSFKESAESHEGIGCTYEGWHPTLKLNETRWCRRIIDRHKTKDKSPQPYTVDLEWAIDTGPIKLVIFKDGEKLDDKWFDHSVDGMKSAFTYAKSLTNI